jgi:hypothetical protein
MSTGSGIGQRAGDAPAVPWSASALAGEMAGGAGMGQLVV